MHVYKGAKRACPWCEAPTDSNPMVPRFNGSDDAAFCIRCGRWIVTDNAKVWRRAVASERYLLRNNPVAGPIRAAFVRQRNMARKPE
ncbi:MAG: hypothetical protein ABWY64_21510 [Tardiphaga sp.]